MLESVQLVMYLFTNAQGQGNAVAKILKMTSQFKEPSSIDLLHIIYQYNPCLQELWSIIWS